MKIFVEEFLEDSLQERIPGKTPTDTSERIQSNNSRNMESHKRIFGETLEEIPKKS